MPMRNKWNSVLSILEFTLLKPIVFKKNINGSTQAMVYFNYLLWLLCNSYNNIIFE